MLLNSEPLVYEGQALTVEEEVSAGAPGRAAAPPKGQAAFVPRTAGRPKAGLGRPRAAPIAPSTKADASAAAGKGQDDFRKLLG
jgi:hypothetical protein